MVDPVPIKAFLSYARKDDKDFQFVQAFATKLQALVLAKSGRPLDIFLDQVDLEWGADWRSRLDVEVENALVFIPLLSANYLRSSACRSEFLAFHSKAKVLEVTDLLLPVLLFESPLFAPDSDDQVVRLSEKRQWKPFEEALLAGPSAPLFNSTVAGLAGALLNSLDKAEARLSTVKEAPPQPPTTAEDEDGDEKGDGSGGLSVGPDPTDPKNPPGLVDLLLRLEASIDRMTEAANALGPAIERFGSAAEGAEELPSQPTARDFQTWSSTVAERFAEPARELEEGGQQLLSAVTDTEDVIKGFRYLSASADDQNISETIDEGLSKLLTELGDLSEVERSLEGLLKSMRPAELTSVSLRAALAPARRGLNAVTDSLRTIASWLPSTMRVGRAFEPSLPPVSPRVIPQDHQVATKRNQPHRRSRKRRH